MSGSSTIRWRNAQFFRSLLMFFGAVAVSACVSTPDVVAPVLDAAVGADWIVESVGDEKRNVQSVDSTWWLTFDDPVLNQLIESATRNGYDIRKSQSRLREGWCRRDGPDR